MALNRTDTKKTDTQTMITGIFADQAMADRAYNVVAGRGYRENEINVLMSEETHKTHYGDTPTRGKVEVKKGNKAAEGAGVGGGVGVGLGAVIVAALAAGAPFTLPGLVIAGPLAGALTGAGAGGVVGGIIGALIGAGIPEERAKVYEERLNRGGIVLGVIPHNQNDADFIQREWKALGGKDVYTENVAYEHSSARI